MPGKHLDSHHQHPGPPAAPEDADPTKLTCPRCGATVSYAEPSCPQCGEVFFSAPDREADAPPTVHAPNPALTDLAQQVDSTNQRFRLLWLVLAAACVVVAIAFANSARSSGDWKDWDLAATFAAFALFAGLAAFSSHPWTQIVTRVACGLLGLWNVIVVVLYLTHFRSADYYYTRHIYYSGALAVGCLLYAVGGPQLAASLAENSRVEREDSWFPRLWR